MLERIASVTGSREQAALRLRHDQVDLDLARIEHQVSLSARGRFAPAFVVGPPEPPYLKQVDSVPGLAVFAGPWPELMPDAWLAIPLNRKLLSELRLDAEDQLLVSTNLVDLRGTSDDPRLWQERVFALAQVVDRLQVPGEDPVTEEGVAALARLGLDAGTARHWGISDDAQLDERVRAASDADLQSFVDALKAIDQDRFVELVDEGRSPAALMAGWLSDAHQIAEAELAMRHEQTATESG